MQKLGGTEPPTNWQLPSDTLSVMPKRTTPPKRQSEQTERTHVTSGINLPVEIYELLNRVAFSRSLKNGGRPSVSALLVDLVLRHRKELEKELVPSANSISSGRGRLQNSDGANP